MRSQHNNNQPGPVLAQRSDDRIHSRREVAVLRDNAKRLHVRALERVQPEERIKYGGVHRAPDPHEQVVRVLQQEDAVGGQSVYSTGVVVGQG